MIGPSIEPPCVGPLMRAAKEKSAWYASLYSVALAIALASFAVDAGQATVDQVLAMPDASLLIEERGKTRIAYQVDRLLVPASTMKLLTALAAIERWGLAHRFYTDFYLDDDQRLWVEGRGDPYLVSEELDLIAAALAERLRARGARRLAGIAIDDGYFVSGLDIPGRSSSTNPYDAPLSALALNFNSVSLSVNSGGTGSGEPQTPLTQVARELGRGLPAGRHRVNLRTRERAVRHFSEVLAAKLADAGIGIEKGATFARLPRGAKRLYRHENTRNLGEIIASMLEYSNNFVANDLFILLGARGNESGLSLERAQRRANAWVAERFGWTRYRIDDGAGLSRANRLSARQLLDVVEALAPYRGLLPAQDTEVRAKSGTLRGVSCYAGFVERNGDWEPFALMINQPVSNALRKRVAAALAEG